jgi:hypothetical protein
MLSAADAAAKAKGQVDLPQHSQYDEISGGDTTTTSRSLATQDPHLQHQRRSQPPRPLKGVLSGDGMDIEMEEPVGQGDDPSRFSLKEARDMEAQRDALATRQDRLMSATPGGYASGATAGDALATFIGFFTTLGVSRNAGDTATSSAILEHFPKDLPPHEAAWHMAEATAGGITGGALAAGGGAVVAQAVAIPAGLALWHKLTAPLMFLKSDPEAVFLPPSAFEDEAKTIPKETSVYLAQLKEVEKLRYKEAEAKQDGLGLGSWEGILSTTVMFWLLHGGRIGATDVQLASAVEQILALATTSGLAAAGGMAYLDIRKATMTAKSKDIEGAERKVPLYRATKMPAPPGSKDGVMKTTFMGGLRRFTGGRSGKELAWHITKQFGTLGGVVFLSSVPLVASRSLRAGASEENNRSLEYLSELIGYVSLLYGVNFGFDKIVGNRIANAKVKKAPPLAPAPWDKDSTESAA